MFDQNLTIVIGPQHQPFGTGKTYFTVRNAYEAYKHGAIVVSNMWLAFPHVRWYETKDLVPILHEIDKYHVTHITPYDAPDSFLVSHGLERSDIEPRSFYILADEGSIFFDARNFSKNFSDPALTAMLATPRHLNMQITVISQQLDLLDKRFKDLANEIIQFDLAFFGFARRAESLNKMQVLDQTFHEEIDVLDKKTYWMYFHHKKDMSQHFGGLYYTKELLGPRALRRVTDITTLSKFFEIEEDLFDWRTQYAQKLGYDILENGRLKKIIEPERPADTAGAIQ